MSLLSLINIRHPDAEIRIDVKCRKPSPLLELEGRVEVGKRTLLARSSWTFAEIQSFDHPEEYMASLFCHEIEKLKTMTDKQRARHSDGFYEDVKCTCWESCHEDCDGERCGCQACEMAYQDALSCCD